VRNGSAGNLQGSWCRDEIIEVKLNLKKKNNPTSQLTV